VNWLFLDLRGSQVKVDLQKRAEHIRDGVAKAGRIGNKDGVTYDKIYFILDEVIVCTPPPRPPPAP